ncbi:Ribosomal RNA large subunit methyltransferase F [Neolewinella maritima]|uniref:Ribosomal RNA large subunit methyltransferase F n=1 Tax=Neolewinella maritima TaxID=1383882 RepID=A0ABN8F7Q4_9BACT|nr:23S rRNA (adenine(1618)-N(6))-methyltransferase RlmF [Neolewinella maritima]CAH1000144.1 Ribosomal RNA large subunit methyltransferase F [Neolewinella maritima]
MHPKNRYRGPYDLAALCALEPELTEHLIRTPDGRTSLDFGTARAVYLLNRTLLKRDYRLAHWDLPKGYLTPPIPGRLDYIHLLADLVPQASRVLDIGTGASLIYPILGSREYGWSFVATDINPVSVKVARAIVSFNSGLSDVTVRQQTRSECIFQNMILAGEFFDLTMCNPPFHADRPTAVAAGRAKWRKLGTSDRGLTFGGVDKELHTPGGELRFLHDMIKESKAYARQVGWFTTLVSKKGYLSAARQQLDRLDAREVRVLALDQGNKQMRVLAWCF